MKHICNEHEEWMGDMLCSYEGCQNPAKHDWVAEVLCCAHDHVMNLYLLLDQRDEEIMMLKRDLHQTELSAKQWHIAWLEAVEKVQELEHDAASIA
jgi:hypothetical protein